MSNIGVTNGNWRGSDMRNYLRDVARRDDNGEYWEQQANNRLVELMDIVGDDKARAMTNHIEGTWKHIHDEIKKLVNQTPTNGVTEERCVR